MFSDFFKFVGVAQDNNIKGMNEFLMSYSGVTFLNGLYRLHKLNEVTKWTEIIRNSFPKCKGEILVFGFDWLGRNFALDKERNVVLIFEPGTGEVLNTEMNFKDFHNREMPKYHEACLASAFFKEWYEANNHYILNHNQCAGYKIPLFLNGEDTIENLEVSDMEVYWEIMMPLINL